jgi:hypothetical protein
MPDSKGVRSELRLLAVRNVPSLVARSRFHGRAGVSSPRAAVSKTVCRERRNLARANYQDHGFHFEIRALSD